MPKIAIPKHAMVENLVPKQHNKKQEDLKKILKRIKHSCPPCEFFNSQYDPRKSNVVKLYGEIINNPELVPHYSHPNDFDDPDYKFAAMRNVYMVKVAKKHKELEDGYKRRVAELEDENKQLKLRLERFESAAQSGQAAQSGEDAGFGHTLKNPKPVNEGAAPDEQQQCPRCSKWYKNLMTYRDHIQKCGRKWRCPDCGEEKMMSSKQGHKKVCKQRLFMPDEQ